MSDIQKVLDMINDRVEKHRKIYESTTHQDILTLSKYGSKLDELVIIRNIIMTQIMDIPKDVQLSVILGKP